LAPTSRPTSLFDSSWSETVRLALNAGPIEPEDRLLADVLDLLGHARLSRSAPSSADDFSADDLALAAVLQQLL
jgi:hypothetical protein